MQGEFVAEKVWKRYGSTVALSNVSLRLGKGLNVLVGPNGSGKSTLLRLFTGFARPSKGSIRSLGLNPWRDRDKLLKRIGVVFEGASLPWWLSGREVLELLASRRSTGSFSRIKEYAELLGVTRYWDRSIRGYSMGMRKKLLLVAGFGLAVDALILDEPYTLLDARSVRIVDELIRKVSRDIPVLVATHVITETTMLADKVVVLVGGVMIASFSKESFEGGYICKVKDKNVFLRSLQKPHVLESLKYLVYSEEDATSVLHIPGASSKELEGVEECFKGLTLLLSLEKYMRKGPGPVAENRYLEKE